MTQAEGFLTDGERQDLEHGRAYERAEAMHRVGELGMTLGPLSEVIDRLRGEDDDQLVRHIGKKAHQLSALLARIDVLATREVEEPLPEPNKAVLSPEEPLPEVAAVVEEESSAQEASSSPETSPRDGWLVASLGHDWRERLSLDPGATNEAIARRLVEISPPRKPNTPERSIVRIVGYLEGRSYEDIASWTEGETSPSVYQYIRALPRRLAVELARQDPTPKHHQEHRVDSLDEGRRLLRKAARQGEGLPDHMTSDEWRTIAEEQVRIRATEKGLAEGEVNRLWTRLHYDEEGAYAVSVEAGDELLGALKKLQSLFLSQDNQKQYTPKELAALRPFLDTTRGTCSLDDVWRHLSAHYDISKQQAQYNLVSGVVELLHES